MSSSDNKISDSSPIKEFELLDFQHKRVYDRYLIEMELTKSLRGTDRFRLTVLSVIATIGISVFLSTFLLGGSNDIPNVTQYYLFIIIFFIIDLSCLFVPVISAYHNSDKFSEDVISKDRGIILDEIGTPDKQTIQKNDIEMWTRRIWQTGGHVKKYFEGISRNTNRILHIYPCINTCSASNYSREPRRIRISILVSYRINCVCMYTRLPCSVAPLSMLHKISKLDSTNQNTISHGDSKQYHYSGLCYIH